MRVFVKDHALRYIRGGCEPRTRLSYQDLELIVSRRAYIEIHRTDIAYGFTWDWHLEKGVVLLIGNGNKEDEIAIVSVWEASFRLNFTLPMSRDKLEKKAFLLIKKAGLCPKLTH